MGREHALLFAAEGAKVVVNDNGCGPDGSGSDPSLAAAVAAEITAAGGEAVPSADDVATMDGAAAVLAAAVEAFGDVHVLVNNAGILRDRMFVNMTEDDWDAVIRGHLKSTFCMTRNAAGRWRDQSKAGETVNASVVNVSSTSGLIGQVGQSNYGAAKSGIASMTVILAQELGRYGVRVNAIVPVARTRMTEEVAGIADMVRAPDDAARVRHVPPRERLTTRRIPRDGRLPAHGSRDHGALGRRSGCSRTGGTRARSRTTTAGRSASSRTRSPTSTTREPPEPADIRPHRPRQLRQRLPPRRVHSRAARTSRLLASPDRAHARRRGLLGRHPPRGRHVRVPRPAHVLVRDRRDPALRRDDDPGPADRRCGAEHDGRPPPPADPAAGERRLHAPGDRPARSRAAPPDPGHPRARPRRRRLRPPRRRRA